MSDESIPQQEPAARKPDGFEETKDGRVFMTVDGASYELGGIGPDDGPALKAELARRMRDPITAVVEQLEAEAAAIPAKYRDAVKKELFDRAYRSIQFEARDRAPTEEEFARWLGTDAGKSYSCWFMLHKCNPSVTQQAAEELFARVDKAEFVKARARASKALLEAAERKRQAA